MNLRVNGITFTLTAKPAPPGTTPEQRVAALLEHLVSGIDLIQDHERSELSAEYVATVTVDGEWRDVFRCSAPAPKYPLRAPVDMRGYTVAHVALGLWGV